MSEPEVICIDGVVGVGKSTVIDKLAHKLRSIGLSVHVIHEYIDVLDDAGEMLQKYLHHEIPAVDFQDYILRYYDRSSMLIGSYDYVLVDRCPIAGLKFFGGLDVALGRMSEYDYDQLMDYATSLTFYPDPSETYSVDTTGLCSDDVVDVCYKLIARDKPGVIKLTASPDVIFKRIQHRNRAGEVEAYDKQYIQHMIDNY